MAEPRRRAWWRRYVRSALFVLVSGVSLYFLLPSLMEIFSSWRSLSHLNWYWMGGALLCEGGSIVFLWELDRIALPEKRWFPVACAQLTGSAVSKVVPGGGAASVAVSVNLLRRAGIEAGQAATSLAATSVLQIATRLALPVIALPAILGGTRINHNLATSAYLGLAVLVLLIAAGVAAFAFDRPLELTGRAVQWVANETVRRHRKLVDLPRKLLLGRDFVRSTLSRGWRPALLATVGSTGLDYAALLCALRAVHAQPRPSLVVLAYAAAGLLALVPLTPGGLGFVEAGLVGTLSLAGIAPKEALLATLAYRLVSYWLPIPVGGLAYLAFRRRYARPSISVPAAPS